MITNLPTSSDYMRVAKQCLTQAFNIVYGIDKHLDEIAEDPSDVWEYHLGDLSTSLILVHQGIESLLKSEICKVSPVLLIDAKREDWPTLPNSGNKDYNELFTVGGEGLIRTYCAVINHGSTTIELIKFVEDIRLTRNKIVHGLTREYLDPEYLLELILGTYTYFLGKDSWWLSIREMHINNPMFGSFDGRYEEAILFETLEYVQRVLEQASFRKHFEFNLKARSYYCPWCYVSLRMEDTDLESQWAFLVPQGKSGVTTIKCLCCQRQSDVQRIDCIVEDCKGNVQWNDDYDGIILCATCLTQQD